MNTAQRTAVMVICDGLHPSWIQKQYTPFLYELRAKSLYCANHKSVVPSVTRCCAASITTGCLPHRHGLYGNTVALLHDGRYQVHDVGAPSFPEVLRNITGRSLKVPALASYMPGTSFAYANASFGAAYFLDPEHHGWLYHRQGSFAPGGRKLQAPEALCVSHDPKGDQDMTLRFCCALTSTKNLSLAILWLAAPDIVTHYNMLGSSEHIAALQSTDKCVRKVSETIEVLRQQGRQILFMTGSDHGAEQVGESVDVYSWLGIHGFVQDVDSGQLALAPQGNGVVVYATKEMDAKLEDLFACFASAPWVQTCLTGEELSAHGLGCTKNAEHAPVAFLNMAACDNPQSKSFHGARFSVTNLGNGIADSVSICNHGGLGSVEMHPFLLLNGASFKPGSVLSSSTSLLDIAPTILDFHSICDKGMDGQSIMQLYLEQRNQPIWRKYAI